MVPSQKIEWLSTGLIPCAKKELADQFGTRSRNDPEAFLCPIRVVSGLGVKVAET